SQRNLHTTTKSLKDNISLSSLSRPAPQKPSPLPEDTTQPKFNDDIKNFISNAITDSIKNLTQTPPSQPITQSTNQDDERLIKQTPIHQTSPTTYHLEQPLVPTINKFDGQIDFLEYIENLETRFSILPYQYTSDRLKVITAVENLAGPIVNNTDSPKQWARLELRYDEHLKDNWPALKQRLQERQSLKQPGITVQEYKQKFEKLCYQTKLPKNFWGDEFYKRLSSQIKDKLAAIATLDRRDYSTLTLHAVKFDEAYHARQRERG
ncbi:hypothetical protein GcM3_067026, partial [Golovinomyces cichoracearum]